MKSKTNEWVLNKVDNKERLLSVINRRMMAFAGHILRKRDCEKDLLTGTVYGKRGRERPKTRYRDNIRENLGGRILRKCADGCRKEIIGGPRRFDANPLFDDDDCWL